MKLIDLFNRMENGATHIFLFNMASGEVIIKTIWYNTIPHKFYDWEVDSIEIRDYEMRIGIHD